MTIEITLPTLHPGQVAAFRTPGKRVAVRCGRRWGKTDFGATIACDAAIKRKSVGWFAPSYKIQQEAYQEILNILNPVVRSSSKMDGVIRTITGGRIDFWSLENDRAGRSRKYHKVVIDEAAFCKENMTDIWERSIEPTLLDYSGSALVLSNTNGDDPANFFWKCCNEKKYGFIEYHAPSWQNPHVPQRIPEESLLEYTTRRQQVYEDLKAKTHPLVYQQEYEAAFINFNGAEYFSAEKLTIEWDARTGTGVGVDYPNVCNSVFAVIDSAVKSGREHDATAVIYCSTGVANVGYPLVVLDWDMVTIDGAMLENWVPGVFRRLEELSRDCRARGGSAGVFIEDAQSGSILLQQCARRGWPAQALPSALTAAGKDGRAMNASGPVYEGLVKFSQYALDRTTSFKGVTRNHLWSQVMSYRPGDKAAATRADDGLDVFCYSVAISLGNREGFA